MKAAERAIPILLATAIFSSTVWVLVQYFRTVPLARLERAILTVPTHKLWASITLTTISFAVLGAYDVLAARVVVPGRVPARLAWFAGATGNAMANTLGFHVVTGAAARYRVYRSAGVGVSDMAQIISLSWATLGFGLLTTVACALLIQSGASLASRFIGIAIFGSLIALLLWRRDGAKAIRIFRVSLSLPSTTVAAMQMVLGALEMTAAIGALYVLMPNVGVTFVAFSLAYIGAVLLGIVSHSPGGIGVFEAAMVSLVGNQNRADVLAALLLYRLIYNLLPFAIAVCSLGLFEILRRGRQLDGG